MADAEVQPRSEKSTSVARLDQIDALRGFAVLLVLMHHAWIHAGMYSWPVVRTGFGTFVLSRFFYFTYVGVDLFLVLSGFCLAWPYLKDSSRQFFPIRYARRRFWRIYPPYLIVFVALFLLGLLIRHFDPGTSLQISRWTKRSLIGGLMLQTTTLNSSFWSLCLELRWYFVFPIVVVIAKRWTTWPILVLTLLLCVAMPHGLKEWQRIGVYLPVFVAGVFAAEVQARQSIRTYQALRKFAIPAALLFLLAACRWMPGALDPRRGTFIEAILCSGLFFLVVLAVLQMRDVLPRPLRWLRWMGVCSYTLYLIHEPVIHAIYLYGPTRHWSPVWQFAFWQCLFLPLITLVAYALFHLIERPFLNEPIRSEPNEKPRTSLAVADHAAP